MAETPRFPTAALATLGLVLSLCLGCSPERTVAIEQTYPQTHGGQYAGGMATGDTQAGAAFARWVLEQDPRRDYITDAVVRDEQVLGVKVQPRITRAELRDLLLALTQGMARTFPGRPLQVNAFYQSGDKLAQADYDPRGGDVDIRFADQVQNTRRERRV